jgi:hypothetical protein
MEADWSVELGAGLPTIDVPWSGFADLSRLSRDEIASRVSEAAECPPLSAALARLNAAGSPVLSSKCDTWSLDPSEIDRYEFDADPGSSACGEGCYIDILARDAQVFASFTLHELWVRAFARALSAVPLRQARAEMVLRAASLHGQAGFAVTLYVFGCGADPAAARCAWAAALEAAAAATISTIPIAESNAGE